METIKTPFGKMQVVDEFVIQDDDKVTFCQKAREKYNELDKDGWFDSRSNEPYWYAFPYNRAKFTLCMSKSLGKICFIDYRKEGKDNLFEGYKGPILLGAAALGLGTLSIADHNKIKSTADKLGIELAETEYGSHEAAGLIYPIYEYKYDMKGPMNIDSLCKYLKDNTNFDEITYDDEGDHYVINYIDNYTIHQKVGNATVSKHRTSEGNLNLPKNYFDFSFVLNEARVFSHSSGFGLSGHYGYEAPEEEPLFIATETNEDDGELYFDETGCTTEFETDAKKFTSEEEALEFAKNNVIFGEPGAKLYEKSEYKEKNIMKKLFENGNLFDYILNESSSALKESECSLEQLLANAYVSDYKMGSKNSALVRVRTTPALLTSDSMAARFEEDIPDGYKLEVEYLGEDPVLGRNLDIYEVQLLKN